MPTNYFGNVTSSESPIVTSWTEGTTLKLFTGWFANIFTPILLSRYVPGITRPLGVRIVWKWLRSSIMLFIHDVNSWKPNSRSWNESSAAILKRGSSSVRPKKLLTKWLSATFTGSYFFLSLRFSTEHNFSIHSVDIMTLILLYFGFMILTVSIWEKISRWLVKNYIKSLFLFSTLPDHSPD